MTESIKLYFEGERVDIDNNTQFPITFQLEDLTNPAVTTNSFSKTVSLPATQNNNRLFGHFWNLNKSVVATDASVIGLNFNPLRRVPFVLMINDNIFQTGYTKLSRVNYDNTVVSYEVNLFGGLGDFFLTLSEKDMLDLTLPDNLEHVITRTNVYNALQVNDAAGSQFVSTSGNSLIDYLRYNICYNGLYNNFDSSKFYSNSSGEIEDVAQGELDEHQIRELRSYYQRPILSVRKLIEQIIYEADADVELSSSFFNDDNPYFNNLWLEMPLLKRDGVHGNIDSVTATAANTQEMPLPFYTPTLRVYRGQDFGAQAQITSTTENVSFFTFGANTYVDSNGYLDLTNVDISTMSVNFATQLAIYVRSLASDASTDNLPWTAELQPNYSSTNITVTIAMCDYDATTSNWASKTRISRVVTIDNFKIVKNYYGQIDFAGQFDGTSSISKEFSGSGITSKPTAKQKMVMAVKYNDSGSTTPRMWASSTDVYTPNYKSVAFVVGFKDFEMSVGYDSNIRSGATVSYSDIMPSGITQYDFLISYIKMFGLICRRNYATGKITITTRNEFYSDIEVVDWSDKADNSRQMSVTPLTFEHKYFNMRYAETESYLNNRYKSLFRQDFGQKRINTGYEFSTAEEELHEDTVFANVIMSREYDAYFNFENYRDNKALPAFITMSGTQRSSTDDNFGLIFDTGEIFTETASTSFSYYVTDDNAVMVDSGTYCWSRNPWSGSIGSSTGSRLDYWREYSRLSEFAGDTNYPIYSLDFGKPQADYAGLTDIDYPEYSTIYERFWRRYLEDRWSFNNRIVTKYFYLTPSDISSFAFNRFVLFDNGVYAVNRIIDYNLSTNAPTKVELVRVANPDNYTGQILSPYLMVDPTSAFIPTEGGAVEVAVKSNVSWYVSSYPSWLSSITINDAAITTTSGNATLQVSAPALGVAGQSLAGNVVLTNSQGTLTATLRLAQPATALVFEVSADSLTFNYTGGVQALALNSNVSWTATSSATWFKVVPASGTASATLLVTATGTTLSASRLGTITLTAYSTAGTAIYELTVTVRQTYIP